MWTRILGYVGLGIAVLLLGYVAYRNSGKINETLVFSPQQMTSALWADYKVHFLEADSKRTLDPSRDNITTSEGVSYTMLRAVWMGDKETFDTQWQWAKDNLGHQDDALFSWLFGKKSDGTYGVLINEGGNNSASDADTDIALSLIFAHARWQDPAYLESARAILKDLWEDEVVSVAGTYYLAANNVEKTSASEWILINPSYLHPAAYRIFARVDPAHPWTRLASDSYTFLGRAMANSLGGATSALLPPDWVEIHETTGQLRASQNPDLTTRFGYDALRTPWRITLDYQWFNATSARQTLERMSVLTNDWQARGSLASIYAHDGSIVEANESPAMYGGTIGYFTVTNPELARHIYEEKLAFLFNPGTNTWKQRLPYYDDNLAWFGIALYNRLLPNLSANVPNSAYTL